MMFAPYLMEGINITSVLGCISFLTITALCYHGKRVFYLTTHSSYKVSGFVTWITWIEDRTDVT